MKKEHISDALNMLNDDIIEETNNVRTNAKPKRKWVKWGVVAACLCLLVATIPIFLNKPETPKTGRDLETPRRTLPHLSTTANFTRLSNFRRCLRSMVCRLKSPPIWLANTFPT